METIVAVSTALGEGAISIIRLSGEKALEIVNKIFKGVDLTKVQTHTVNYGRIVDREQYIDEVLVSVFLSPRSYTKETVVEINCHGGVFVTNKIVELLLENGAKLAEPGEFTKRAFLNGRIDLTQAEAVMEVIRSKTETALKCANVALRGDVRNMIINLRSILLDCIMKIEVNIDYPEYEDELEVTNTYLLPRLKNIENMLLNILLKAKESSNIVNGIKTAIIGKPNVGKSSLLNSLLHEEKAIVTDVAGTTRDIVEGRLCIGGLILDLLDTAGVRETIDKVEKIGVEKTKNILKEAELIILVLDYSQKLNNIDLELLELTKDKKRIVIINKSDLNKEIDYNGDALEISLLEDKNASSIIENKIKELCVTSKINQIDATYIGNNRQIKEIKDALESIKESLKGLEQGYPVDIVNIDIEKAWKSLGKIIGDNNPEELVNSIFANFCLGK